MITPQLQALLASYRTWDSDITQANLPALYVELTRARGEKLRAEIKSIFGPTYAPALALPSAIARLREISEIHRRNISELRNVFPDGPLDKANSAADEALEQAFQTAFH